MSDCGHSHDKDQKGISVHMVQDDLLWGDMLVHGFFARTGGVSGGMYESLNCGPGSDDEPDNVRENRARALMALGEGVEDGTKPHSLLSLYQIHSPKVVTVGSPWELGQGPKADAMVTKERGLALGILTADCAPVLFADKHKRVIGAAHAGWKGALGGVVEATVAAMVELGANRDGIVAVVGPCIGPGSYEVDLNFRRTFLAEDTLFEAYFTPGKDSEHLQFDLPRFVVDRLLASRISLAEWVGMDTYVGESDFFSYRRTTHRGEEDYGRQVSAIALT